MADLVLHGRKFLAWREEVMEKNEKEDLDWDGFFSVVLEPPSRESFAVIWRLSQDTMPWLLKKPDERFWFLALVRNWGLTFLPVTLMLLLLGM